jgi:hypothetical protein
LASFARLCRHECRHGTPGACATRRFQLAVELGIDDLFLQLGARQPAAEPVWIVSSECAVTAAGLPARMKGKFK